ncbi:hypothetical protein J2T02_002351 [Chitinophaga terrae (ex Kim and Jung 2007)]|nr:hypothetical protein [Chitinophaga terrae (ex Kim and Jung 2007)]
MVVDRKTFMPSPEQCFTLIKEPASCFEETDFWFDNPPNIFVIKPCSV